MSSDVNSGEEISFHEFHQRPSIEEPSICSDKFERLTLTSTPKSKAVKIRYDLRLGMLMSNSRQEFLPGEPNGGNIKYGRQGGVFLSKWGIISIILFLILSGIIVGLLVYFFAPCRDQEERVVEDDFSWYIGDLNPRDSEYTVRLLNSVRPSYYRLKIKPNLTSSTFEGKVTITLSTHKPNVKHISLHVEKLEIQNDTVLTEQQHYFKNNSKKTKRDVNDIVDEKAANDTLEMENDLNNDTSIEVTEKSKENEMPKNDTTTTLHYFGHEIPRYNVTYPNPKKNKIDPIVAITTPPLLSQTKAKQVKIISKELDPSIDRLVFTLESHLKPNINYTLDINFKGVMDDSMNGFYRSTYYMNDTLKVLAITQFEPTSARKAFPCFDEPEYKALFELSIATPKNMTAISNMPLMSQEEVPGEEDWIWSHFERSVPMSSYLLAFTVNDFEFNDATLDNETDEDFEFKIWTRKDLLHQTEYAASIAPRIFDFYENYFGIPYTLPKIDLIAVPDFSSGAMENWGMLTFLESELLIDEKTGSLQAKKQIAMVISHELAHQWFGNLVTMKWWNDLWLNEGFATYMEYIGVQEIRPEWDIMDQFDLDKMAVLALDGVESTRPVSTEVKDEMQINQIFDDISYMKAASLLRMLNHVLTEDIFRDGLSKYMTKWQFRNADQNDLWTAFDDAAKNHSSLPNGVTIVSFMNSWTLEAGYPVIYVSRNYENGSVVVSQKRFYLHKPNTKRAEQLWHVPLTYAYGNTSYLNWTTSPVSWIEKTVNTSITLPSEANSTWIYFNVLAIGHYRVNYDNRNWKLLQYGLYDTPSEFPPVTRAQLLDDTFNLARAGQVSYTVPLDFTKYMIGVEMNYLPWRAALNNLQLLYMGMQRTTHFSKFQEYITRLIMPALEKLGFEELSNDTSQNSLLRNDLIYWACLVEEPKCLDWVEKQFDSWMKEEDPDNNNPIPSNNRMTVYSTAIRAGSKREYDFLFQRYNSTSDPEIQREIIMSLPSSRNTWQIYSLLEYSITKMEKKLTPMFWSGIQSDLATQIAFNFVSSNWKRIYDRYAKVEGLFLKTIIDSAFGNVATEHELRQFKRFVRANKEQLSSVSRTIYQNLEQAVLRIQWGKTKTNDIKKWLDKFAERKRDTINEFSTL